jgi:Uma2 family endonuclease
MSSAEFLKLDGDDAHTEWVNGKVVRLPPVTGADIDLMGFLSIVLGLFVEAHGIGTIRRRPFQMKCGPKFPGRAPDVFFVQEARRKNLKPYYMDGPADLVVEVANAASRQVDGTAKLREYQDGRVREYWLIDRGVRRATFYAPAADGTFVPQPVHRGIFRSRVLDGLCLRVQWLWMPRSPLITAMKELALV